MGSCEWDLANGILQMGSGELYSVLPAPTTCTLRCHIADSPPCRPTDWSWLCLQLTQLPHRLAEDYPSSCRLLHSSCNYPPAAVELAFWLSGFCWPLRPFLLNAGCSCALTSFTPPPSLARLFDARGKRALEQRREAEAREEARKARAFAFKQSLLSGSEPPPAILPTPPFPSFPIPSHPIRSHPSLSHPIPSFPIPSHPIQSYLSQVQPRPPLTAPLLACFSGALGSDSEDDSFLASRLVAAPPISSAPVTAPPASPIPVTAPPVAVPIGHPLLPAIEVGQASLNATSADAAKAEVATTAGMPATEAAGGVGATAAAVARGILACGEQGGITVAAPAAPPPASALERLFGMFGVCGPLARHGAVEEEEAGGPVAASAATSYSAASSAHPPAAEASPATHAISSVNLRDIPPCQLETPSETASLAPLAPLAEESGAWTAPLPANSEKASTATPHYYSTLLLHTTSPPPWRTLGDGMLHYRPLHDRHLVGGNGV